MSQYLTKAFLRKPVTTRNRKEVVRKSGTVEEASRIQQHVGKREAPAATAVVGVLDEPYSANPAQRGTKKPSHTARHAT